MMFHLLRRDQCGEETIVPFAELGEVHPPIPEGTARPIRHRDSRGGSLGAGTLLGACHYRAGVLRTSRPDGGKVCLGRQLPL
jgi:hypothetical protein